MAIVVYFCDLRSNPSIRAKRVLPWRDDLSVFDAIAEAIGDEEALAVRADLQTNNHYLMVFQYNQATDEGSESSAVGSLDWYVDDHTQIIVRYDDGAMPEQIDEFEQWVMDDDPTDDL